MRRTFILLALLIVAGFVVAGVYVRKATAGIVWCRTG